MKNQLHKLITSIFLVLVLMLPALVQAQDEQMKKAEDILKENVISFAAAYATLPETRDVKSVLDFMNPRYQSVMFYFNVSDKTRMNMSGYDGFERYLTRIAQTPGMRVKYDIQDFLYVYVKENVGTTVFTVNYELEEENGFHVRGHETVTMGWKKYGEAWQIVHFTVLGTEDEKLRGSCLCEIFASRGQDYVVRTTVPDGKSYTTGFTEFSTNKVGTDTYIQTSDGAVFKMNGAGEVWQMEGDSARASEMMEARRLGSANEIKGAMLLIVKSYIYPDNCTNIKFIN